VPALVCINKYDINEDNAAKIEDYCREQGIELAARIPFDNIVTQALVKGQPVVKYSDGPISRQIKGLWQKLRRELWRN
jgi:MinD superfamily P-loop ATPase